MTAIWGLAVFFQVTRPFKIPVETIHFSFMARASYFANIFGTSPVTPLQKHIDSVVACVDQLIPYFEAVFAENWGKAAEIQERITELEHTSDLIKNELRLHLPTSLLMPVDRRDILEVLDLQDLIANKAKDIAGLILGRKMNLPGALQEGYTGFLKRCIDATRQAQLAINELDELVVTGFRGDEARRVQNMIQELHKIEHETVQCRIE